MTTTEKNIIIAEFRSYTDNGCSEEGFLINPNTNFDEEIENLKFHSDWNLLMEIVSEVFKKEEQIKDDLIFKLNDALLECNKESVYLSVFNCIKWYNENK